jgi:hypothetical protein
MKLRVPLLSTPPAGFKDKPALPGTSAYDYISGKLPLSNLETDRRLLGALRQHDGALILFKDDTSLVVVVPNSTVSFVDANKFELDSNNPRRERE